MTMGGSDSTIYFSFRPTKGGFADQLQELAIFYRLGRSLGYQYVHRPLRTARSTKPHGIAARITRRAFWPLRALGARVAPETFFDVYEFLGVNEYLAKAHSAPRSHRPWRIEVFLSDGVLREHGVSTFDGLRRHVSNVVETSPHHGRSDLLVEFSLRRDVQWFALVLQPGSDDARLDLRTAYALTRRDRPLRSMFASDALRILVHVRQGDTALIETPWGSYVSVWGRVSNWMTERRSIDEIDTNRIIRESDYYAILERLHAVLGNGPISSLVFSDGYDRAFRILRDGMRKRRIAWTSEQVAAVENQVLDYEHECFRSFRSLDSCTAVVGETRDHLCNLIESLMQCRIVIVGTQGEMIQKLIATYFDPDTMPIVIVLFRGTRPEYRTIDLRGMEERFIYVDVASMDPERVVAQVRAALDRRA